MVEVNLLPWRKNQRKRNREQIISIYLFSLITVFLLLFLVRFCLLHQLKKYEKINQTNSIHAVLPTIPAKENEENTLLHAAQLQHQRVVFDLLKLFGSLHEAIYLSDIACKGKVMHIKGETNLFVDIQQFMKELLLVPQVDFVKLESLKSAATGLQFQIQLVER